MGNGVVSIRVEALGVSITIADASIAIEQTSTETPASPATATSGAVPVSAVLTKRVAPLPKDVDDSGSGRLGCGKFRTRRS